MIIEKVLILGTNFFVVSFDIRTSIFFIYNIFKSLMFYKFFIFCVFNFERSLKNERNLKTFIAEYKSVSSNAIFKSSSKQIFSYIIIIYKIYCHFRQTLHNYKLSSAIPIQIFPFLYTHRLYKPSYTNIKTLTTKRFTAYLPPIQ